MSALKLACAGSTADPSIWIDWICDGLLGWGSARTTTEMEAYSVDVPEHDSIVTPSFVLTEPGTGEPRLLGFTTSPGQHPTARIAGDAWPATPADRAAYLCRHLGVELALVTDARWWALVWAPRGGVTSIAVFDSVTWSEAADRVVVRAFRSLLERRRFFGVPDDQRLPALLRESLDYQEEVTETLGVQVRQAVELLVEAIGRHDLRLRAVDGRGLDDVPASDVYRAAVSVLMRTVFILFAEERGLLPADNEVYAGAYSAGRLCDDLERQVSTVSEEELEHTGSAWHRLLALFTAVHGGVDHPRFRLPAYDGSIFDPETYPWLATVAIDDRTVLHMLRSVLYVTIQKERRRLSFRSLAVEEIGFVYEGLLSFEGMRADRTIVGLMGKPGLEAEVALHTLEEVAVAHSGVDSVAAALADRYKTSGIGTAKALAKRLAPLEGAERAEALRRLLAATANDRALAERLLPFVGILRPDLRGQPTVILAGSLYVTQSPLRRNTGTHYTPQRLAEQVVDGALEPLVYAPGPLDTPDRNRWKLRPSTDILGLKVADIAMGSGAFLVAACRYLARKLVQAWSVEGDVRARRFINAERAVDSLAADAEADPLMVLARREVIQHCLYGVDINPMAVEMAKLSLWLVSMDTSRPFTFLDDRLLAGDSLLGAASIDQVATMHVDPAIGRTLHDRWEVDLTDGIRDLIAETANERRKVIGMPGDDIAQLAAKRALLAEVEQKTARIRLFADLAMGAALAHVGHGERGLRDGSTAAVFQAKSILADEPEAVDQTRELAERWLATHLPPGAFTRNPLHWPIEFPEVFENGGGFDAVIGNPPFLGGQKLTGSMGTAYREYLVHALGRGTRGSADLVAYFVLRAHHLLNQGGQTGLIATNTLAQGDTREVGLDRLVTDGVVIRQAVKSEPWPSKSAVLQYCAIWTTRRPPIRGIAALLDGTIVNRIVGSLDPESRTSGPANRLSANDGLFFIGSYVLGLGFTMAPKEAQALITKDGRNKEVLFPYVTGQDVNSRPDSSGSRWVINFHDWPMERAATYPECFDQVLRLVKPERARNNDRRRREIWWRFTRPAPELSRAIAGLERVVVITLVSKVVMPVMVPTGQVFAHKLGVLASDDPAMLALMSSSPHYWWAISRSSTMKADLNYSPTDVFETFVRPKLTDELRDLGARLDVFRREDVMLARNAGLTATYNLVHDSTCHDADIVELRRIHVEIDHAVAHAYGWHDLVEQGLGHGFHDTRQGVRFTIGPAVRQETLDRLLEENHRRHAVERGTDPPVEKSDGQDALF